MAYQHGKIIETVENIVLVHVYTNNDMIIHTHIYIEAVIVTDLRFLSTCLPSNYLQ